MRYRVLKKGGVPPGKGGIEGGTDFKLCIAFFEKR